MSRSSDPPAPSVVSEQATQQVSAATAPTAQRSAVSEQATQMAASQLPLSPHGQEPPPAPISFDLRPGVQVGEYRVLGRIGEGGMGAVYAAEHPLIGRKVAIKVLNASGANADSSSQRFLQEARAASLVRHRNIVDVFAFGQLNDGRSYLIMEFLEGETLGAYLRRHGPLSFSAALPIINGICAGLKAAHDRGVVHRDLKPENIWLCKSEDNLAPSGSTPTTIDPLAVKLLDFGLAKLYAGGAGDVMLTRAGLAVGTPAFMSPEQCRGDREIDNRSDIYALGVILFDLFAGHVPFDGESVIEVMNHHLRTPPPSLHDEVGMPLALEAVINQALAKYPEDRFEDVAALWQALRECHEARDFVPHRKSARTPGWGASADDATVHGAPSVRGAGPPDDTAGMNALHVGALVVEPQRSGATLTLSFSGETDAPATVDGLTAYLSQLGRQLTSPDEDLRRVVLDLQGLDFLDPAGLSCLGGWLAFLDGLQDEGLAPTTVRYLEAQTWQRTFVHRMQQAHATLRCEAVD